MSPGLNRCCCRQFCPSHCWQGWRGGGQSGGVRLMESSRVWRDRCELSLHMIMIVIMIMIALIDNRNYTNPFQQIQGSVASGVFAKLQRLTANGYRTHWVIFSCFASDWLNTNRPYIYIALVRWMMYLFANESSTVNRLYRPADMTQQCRPKQLRNNTHTTRRNTAENFTIHTHIIN